MNIPLWLAQFLAAGLVANADWRMSLLAGYAGSDFLESMYRLSFAKSLK